MGINDLVSDRLRWRRRALDAEEAIRQLREWLTELDPSFDGPATDYVIGARTKAAVARALAAKR